MSVIPEKFVLESTMSRKQVINRLEKKMVKYTPSMNVLSTGRFMREHKEESIYYGECSGSKVKLFYHRAKKRDGGTTGFFGTITETETGCTIRSFPQAAVCVYLHADTRPAVPSVRRGDVCRRLVAGGAGLPRDRCGRGCADACRRS